ncbi:DUF2026 family protein [Rhizobium leguminosarum]|uniref:DUF2026 family protein n=1 Tax=Rhizobium TaxID=379 RepID=UPI00102F8BBE|nr:DUF2026 family protein [Rhizobium leguminosarum]TBF45281.1 DUF2026 domain-containing protein [Rhizobium leguminosarum]TBG99166.1 DUF2026 domain-containing protein [Rhizobium leguminosarum]
MSRFLLRLSEYNRIYQVAHGVLNGIDGATAEKACLFFAAVGGYVVNQQYKIPARIVGGAFSFCLGNGEVAFFGKMDDSGLSAGPDGFHMWLQTETHIIDFMAPIYREAFAEHTITSDLARKMMQRRLTEESESLDSLKNAGDFRYFPDADLTEQLVDNFLAQPVQEDLLRIAMAWYGKRSAKQSPNFAITDNRGEVRRLTLPSTLATGSW